MLLIRFLHVGCWPSNSSLSGPSLNSLSRRRIMNLSKNKWPSPFVICLRAAINPAAAGPHSSNP
jgi:hypothetical protein